MLLVHLFGAGGGGGGMSIAADSCLEPLLLVEDLAAAAAAAAEIKGVRIEVAPRFGAGGGVRLATEAGEALCLPAERAERGSSFIGEAARDGVGVVLFRIQSSARSSNADRVSFLRIGRMCVPPLGSARVTFPYPSPQTSQSLRSTVAEVNARGADEALMVERRCSVG